MIQHQQQRHSQQQPQQRQFQFDQIFVVKSSSSSNNNNNSINNNFANASSVVPAVLVYERKYIYAGTNANWKLNFKDLFQVKVDLTTTTTTTSSNDHQRNHHHRSGGSSNRGGGNNRGDEVLTLTLLGRKISLKCIARMNSNSSSSSSSSNYSRGRGEGGNAADRQHQLEEFIEGLKSVHRRMTSKQMKQDVDDDYDTKYYTDGKNMMGNDAYRHRGGTIQPTNIRQRHQQQHQHHQQLQARKRAPVVTPAQYTNHKSQSLYLPAGGEKKHPTSGAFQSPAKPHVTAKSSLSSSMRHADVGSSMRRNNNDGGYAHYDPAMDVEEIEADFPGEDDAKPESSVVITGNVVPSPSAVRKLNLPSRSPRNASPVKIRKTMSKLPNRRLEVVGGSGRQLHGISGGDIRLRDRNGMMMSTKSTSRRMEDEFEFRDDDEGESEDERARQRLQKGRINDDDDEEEDYGFDVGGFDDDDDGEVRSKCKKRLRMSIADDDDDDKDEEEIVKPRGNTKLRLSIDDDDMDDDGDDVVKSTGEVSRTKDKFETTQDASEATVDVALSSEEIQAHKKAALANFFAPKANSAEGTFDKSKKEAIAKLFATKTKSGEGAEDKSDAALDASDDLDETATKATVDEPALSSEEKQARKASFFAPRTKSAKPKSETNGALLLSTPSKKVPSGMGEDRSATPPHSSITPVPMLTQRKSSKYFSNINVKQNRPSSPPPRFQNYSSEEGEGEDEQEEEEPQYQTTRDRLQSTFPSRRNTYGRKGLGLGQSRLGNRLDNRGPFDFDRYKASSSPSNSVQRNPYFNSKTISPSGLASPSKADLALGSGRKSTTGGRGIFIRPSNYEKEPPAKVPPQTAIPGIQNLGNTCYLSASLQTLFGIPSFVTDLYRTYAEARSANTSGDDETMPLTRALLEVAVVIGVLAEEDASCIRPEAAKPNKFSSSLAANPSALKKQMDVLTDKFAG